MTESLQVKLVSFPVLVDTDAGSGAEKHITTWMPNLDKDWYYLGLVCTDTSSVTSRGIIVKELIPGALCDVIWQQVWDSTGSGERTDYALWRPLAILPGYIALGGWLTKFGHGPSAEQSRRVRAVRADILTLATASAEVWTGPGLEPDRAVWNVSSGGATDTIDTGAFVIGGHDIPPSPVYVLNALKVKTTSEQVDKNESS